MASDKTVVQQEDGIISLKLANAGCYCDVTDPSNNTAEWNVNISKPGLYKVWLSNSTRDTLNLKYTNSVRVNLADSQLVAMPVCNRTIQKSKDVSYPYYRVDSYMGSVYISQPGECNVQIISEKVLAKAYIDHTESLSDNSTLMAVILAPTEK